MIQTELEKEIDDLQRQYADIVMMRHSPMDLYAERVEIEEQITLLQKQMREEGEEI